MLEVYKNFELIGVDPQYKQMMWRRNFSETATFQIITPFDAEKFNLFKAGNILYRRELDEAMIIETVNDYKNSFDELMLTIEGKALSSILNRRLLSINGTFTLKTFLETVINNNFITGATNKRIPQMRLLPINLDNNNVEIKADFRQTNVLEDITKVLQVNNAGFKMFYNILNKTYDLLFYSPTQTAVTLSQEFTNVIEQNYVNSEESYKNVVYVGDSFVYNDNITGLERREMYVTAPADATPAELTQTALNALNENRKIEKMSNVINPYSEQFIYMDDWDIGSVVTSQNERLEFSARQIITQITEVLDETGLNLEVNLEDYEVVN